MIEASKVFKARTQEKALNMLTCIFFFDYECTNDFNYVFINLFPFHSCQLQQFMHDLTLDFYAM